MKATKLLRLAGVAALLGLELCQIAPAAEPSPIGRWWTIDDDTGAQNGVIEIEQSGDELIGRIVKIVRQPGDPANPVCKKCEGAEKNQPILGLTILRGFHRDGDEWDGGTILDPRSGNVYSSQMRLGDGGRKLLVRGYLGISLLGRTQTWTRAE